MNNNVKLKFYYDHVLGTVYAEGESPFHKVITKDVVERFIVPENIDKNANGIDLGCGPGYFLDEMKDLGYTQIKGISLSKDDIDLCVSKGHTVVCSDMNFLNEADESVDLLFCRHSLEHSPFPYITLLEYNRVLKPGALLYIEVPAPDCDQRHEDNRNHFSILGRSMWLSLLQRTGFVASWYDYEFEIKFDAEPGKVALEKYFIFVCRKKMSVDIK